MSPDSHIPPPDQSKLLLAEPSVSFRYREAHVVAVPVIVPMPEFGTQAAGLNVALVAGSNRLPLGHFLNN
jgi:hypothetical protein